MKLPVFLAALVFATAVAALPGPTHTDQYGPHGGKLIGSVRRPIEVKLGPPKEDRSRDVDVYMLNQPKMNPQSGSVKLFPGEDGVNPIVLQAAPYKDPGDTGPHYQGSLTPGQQNNFGIQIGFPVPGGKEIVSSREEIDALEGKTATP